MAILFIIIIIVIIKINEEKKYFQNQLHWKSGQVSHNAMQKTWLCFSRVNWLQLHCKKIIFKVLNKDYWSTFVNKILFQWFDVLFNSVCYLLFLCN